jgi:hypothetical protein
MVVNPSAIIASPTSQFPKLPEEIASLEMNGYFPTTHSRVFIAMAPIRPSSAESSVVAGTSVSMS